MLAAVLKRPGASLPVAMQSVAAREAAYRFLSNRQVTLGRVLESHVESTVARARSAKKVLLVSDTTEFKFSTEREGLGMLSSRRRNGFLGHFTLAVTADGCRRPLGVLGVETLTRAERKRKRDHFARKKDPHRESLRWQRCAEAASHLVEGVEAIHVMDREADIYELLAALAGAGQRFIIRDDASKAASELSDAIKEGQSYEKKDNAYAEWVKAKRDLHDKAKEPIALAKARLDFMSGPAELREKAASRFKEGKASKDNAEKRAAFTEAKKLYDQCQDACRKALTANPGISRLPIIASGKKTTPEALDTACSAEWQDVDKAEKKLKPEKAPPPPPKKKKK